MNTIHQIETELPLNSPEEMAEFGAKLAIMLRQQDVLFLIGDLGVGKTTLARGIILALLGKDADVSSPTYNLVHVWDGPECEIWHADLYRLQDPAEVLMLGLEDAFSHAITIVEWPDRMGKMAPENRLDICIEKTEDGRKIMLRAMGTKWKERLNEQ